MLTCHQLGRAAFTWWQYSLEMLSISLTKRGLKITHLKSQPHFPGGNKLSQFLLFSNFQYHQNLFNCYLFAATKLNKTEINARHPIHAPAPPWHWLPPLLIRYSGPRKYSGPRNHAMIVAIPSNHCLDNSCIHNICLLSWSQNFANIWTINRPSPKN